MSNITIEAQKQFLQEPQPLQYRITIEVGKTLALDRLIQFLHRNQQAQGSEEMAVGERQTKGE